MKHDPFRPSSQPAQTIYDAFQDAAAQRKRRTVDEWIRLELEAVHEASRQYAALHGLREPIRAQVESAELYAQGSVDYGAQWAYRLSRAMTA